MSYNPKTESSSGLGLIVVLLLLCMGGTMAAINLHTPQPVSRVYVPERPEPAKASVSIQRRDYLSFRTEQVSR